MNCEICGKPMERRERHLIEMDGVEIQVCGECSSYGLVVEKPITPLFKDNPPQKTPRKESRNFYPENEKALAEDFAEIIRKAREKKGLTVKELALKLFEKESVMHRIEAGKFVPSNELIRKLENFLNIKLHEEKEE